ncbi:MAG: redoxin domain-containing protein [Xanthomonadales bacterium]|nr:TlpA family protein disulfide reductase [Xanthomonadales bacterium]NIX11752.1 redoxin domain-containing protein [Xanthomonadales bacterium]
MMARIRTLAVSLLLYWAAPLCAGDAPIDFTLPSLGGADVSLSSLRGQWVVLNYWATWCAPCRKEIPELSELHERRQDVVILGLAFEDAAPEDFDAFLEEFHVSYPILLVDVYAPPEPFGAPRVMPTSIVLDPEGREARTFIGPVTGDMLEEFIDGNEGQ